jgi:hypothetical protein
MSGRPAEQYCSLQTSLAAHDIATEAGNGDAPDTGTFCFILLEGEQY